LDFRQAAAETRALWARANGYLQETAPWTAIRSDPARAAVATRTALNLVRLCAVVAWSIVPSLAEKVLSALGDHNPTPAPIAPLIPPIVPPWPTRPGDDLLREVDAGQPIGAIGPLVAKLTDADIARLSRRFAGDEQGTG
jgi:methionyl-tRNA synthetase